ncbi:conserved Plasmodium protein, unknown function [Plasmodium ovale wallikeri]|uniref:Uncharacterized protein n=1 Tax=Plasmodium ovale wallikeri TaxID=864142 RepID=A0A1A8YMY2_PLAOA|nr:conserved Plasmodium protein, unknown function [Plasmodium ovale wallikeri]SBT33359.1 conserved Plasmodium protein, unknown function [Plasmodium ovale wallikeri]
MLYYKVRKRLICVPSINQWVFGKEHVYNVIRCFSSIQEMPKTGNANGNVEQGINRIAEKEYSTFDSDDVRFESEYIDEVTREIYDKIADEHKLGREQTNRSNRKRKNCERKIRVRSSKDGLNGEEKEDSKSDYLQATADAGVKTDGEKHEVTNGHSCNRDVSITNHQNCRRNDIVVSEVDRRITKRSVMQRLSNDIVSYTKNKEIKTLLENCKENKLTINEKKKNDHFYKIFFSSKKVKIIKSQNHPIYIHLYKLATDMKYRQKQEKILLTNKKIILEREKDHISRIYTNSIDNIKDLHSYDNFILLSNRLLKKLSFLYSFKNGIIAEVSHKYGFDDVGLPHLAFCFYNINRTHPTGKTPHEEGTFAKYDYDDVEFLCNGDIGTIIRSCFLLKWQCVFNVEDLKMRKTKRESLSGKDIVGNTKKGEVMDSLPTSGYRKFDINNVYDVDFFHPFTVRASAGHILDIPYKTTNLKDIHRYAKENKILLIKYGKHSNLYIDYKKNYSEQDQAFLHLLSKAKGVFLIMDNCNNIEKKYKPQHRNYIHIGASDQIDMVTADVSNETVLHDKDIISDTLPIVTNNEDDPFDNIYYVNLKQTGEKPLGLIATHSIFMYILKTNFFRHIPQSPYICMQ